MYFDLISTFFRIGLFTIGGGYAMIPLIQQKVVEEKRWVSEAELMDLMAVAQSCPGIFAINISIFIGYKTRGVRGAILCALGTALPSFIIILLIALLFQHFREYTVVERMFRGIRPAVVALIAAPVFKMAKTAKVNRYTIWIPIASALLIWLLGFNPVYVIILAGAGGYAWGRMRHEGKEEEAK
ncbi:MAG: chromate transporter [Prevotellaceae bacterium]|nr:chromate transporter [Prevotellaceae bacterium]